MALNLISSVAVFAIQLLINFFLTPFILQNLGDEAYGFLSLTNSLINYGYILTIVINSVVGRFVAYEFHRGNLLEASKYYSTAISVNLGFSVIICAVSAILILNLGQFINVSDALYFDVQATFAIYSANFCLGLFNAILSIHAFAKNQIYLIAVRSAISSAVFGAGIFAFYYFLPPMIAYAAICALMASFFTFFSSLLIAKRLNLGVEFRLKLARAKMLAKLVKSGSWNSFNALSHSLINGVDILLCNIFINPAAMGVLAVSKAAILIIESFIAMLGAVFSPKFVELYAKNDVRALVLEVKFALKTQAFLAIAPICVFIALGSEFYGLWLPFKNEAQIREIYALAVIAAAPVLFLACMYPLLNLNVVTNELKRPALANMAMAICSVLCQVCALEFSDYGLYALFFIASFFYVARVLLFDIINAAVNLKLAKTTFFSDFGLNLLVFVALSSCIFFLKSFFSPKDWLELILLGFFLIIFGYIFSLFAIFDKIQRQRLFGFFKLKFKGILC